MTAEYETNANTTVALSTKGTQERQPSFSGFRGDPPCRLGRPDAGGGRVSAQHGIAISRESLRKWLIEAKLWRTGRLRVEQAHVWRARRARYGELVQWDTSEHDWLEGRGEKLYLIAMIDDATSRLTAGFVRHDSTEGEGTTPSRGARCADRERNGRETLIVRCCQE